MALALKKGTSSIENTIPFSPKFQEESIYQTIGFSDAYGVCAMCHEEKELGILTGAPGIGKTTTLKEFAKDYAGEVIFFTARPEMSTRDFIQQFATQLGLGVLYGSAYERTTAVIQALLAHPHTIIIDEAENLAKSSVTKLEILRHIYDDSGVGIMIAGTPRLRTLLIKGPSYRENLSQLYSRVSYFMELTGLAEEDVGQILSSHKVNNAARQALWKIAADINHGGTRMFFKVWKLLLKVLNSETTEITGEMVKQISGKYLLTGR